MTGGGQVLADQRRYGAISIGPDFADDTREGSQMATVQAITTEHPGGEDDLTARAIADMVAGTERTSGIVITGVMAVAIGMPLLLGVLHGHPLLGAANALLLGLVGWGLAMPVHALVLSPVRIVRYSRAAKRLGRSVQDEAQAVALHRSWSEGAPGAITVARDGRVWLADRSTRYRPVTLDRTDIHHAEAISHMTVDAPSRSRVAMGVGVPIGGGLIATLSRTPRERPAQVRTSHALVLHYLERGDSAVRATTIPFGSDLAGARFMAAVLDFKPD
jgi:hypothetical protein